MLTISSAISNLNYSEVHSAAKLLQNGKLVVIPTETVYGLAGDATNDASVAAIFAAKGRPSINPLIIHFARSESAWDHVELNPIALKLAEKFWPGPLTIVLPRKPSSPISLLASAGLDTLAVRVPAHPIARAVIHNADCPIAAPSANQSTGISPTRAEHITDPLNKYLEAIIDGGPCYIGVESTVIAVGDNCIDILRPGGITKENLKTVISDVSFSEKYTSDLPTNVAPPSPGMMSRHYAPNAPVRLNVKVSQPNGVLLGFGPNALKNAPAGSLNLSERSDLEEAASNLFTMLRHLDALNPERIDVSIIPNNGLGVAINDRLRRAAISEICD